MRWVAKLRKPCSSIVTTLCPNFKVENPAAPFHPILSDIKWFGLACGYHASTGMARNGPRTDSVPFQAIWASPRHPVWARCHFINRYAHEVSHLHHTSQSVSGILTRFLQAAVRCGYVEAGSGTCSSTYLLLPLGGNRQNSKMMNPNIATPSREVSTKPSLKSRGVTHSITSKNKMV